MPSHKESIRLKLTFDQPPPGMPASSKYMILVKPASCGSVHDLEQLIIRKFGLAKGATLSLALDGFILVSTEEVQILNTDDCVSVSVHYDIQRKQSKRKLDSNTVVEKNKSKVAKIDKKIPENQWGSTKKKILIPVKILKPRSTALAKTMKRKDASSSSCSSDEKKPKSKTVNGIKRKNAVKIMATARVVNTSKKASEAKKRKAPTSSSEDSSSDTSSSPDDEKTTKADLSVLRKKSTSSTTQNSVSVPKVSNSNGVTIVGNVMLPSPNVRHCKTANIKSVGHVTFSSSSESEMETEGTKHVTQDQDEMFQPNSCAGNDLKTWLNSSNIKTQMSDFSANGSSHTKLRDPGVSTNISTVYQNPSQKTKENECNTEKQSERSPHDYSKLFPSTWPPRVGDIVAYKLLEMSEDYTPVISEYKEAKIIEIYTADLSPIGVNSVKAENLWPKQQSMKRTTGRFEMEKSDDESNNENEQVLEWQSLLEPLRIE